MKTAAVIAEYNPFHKGHAWLLSQLRQAGKSQTTSPVVIRPDFTSASHRPSLPKVRIAAAALPGAGDRLPSNYRCAHAVRGHRRLYV